MNGILPKPEYILKRSQIKQPILLFRHFSRLATVIRCMKVHCHFTFQLGKTSGWCFRPRRVSRKKFLPAESSLISRCLATHGCADVWRIEVCCGDCEEICDWISPGLVMLSRCVWETGLLLAGVTCPACLLPDKAWLPATRHNYTSPCWWDPVLHLQTDGKILSAVFRILFNTL